MMLHVDPSSAAPAYEQLRDQVLRLAVGGRFHPGERLPTIRQLAADLALAKGTVERAYELLERDGVIARRGSAGSFIAEQLPVRTASEAHSELIAEARRFAVAARQLGMSDADAVQALTAVLDDLPEA